MLIWSFLLLLSLIILWQSSSLVLIRVKRNARAFGVSEIAVTLLALSILTAFPEFLVSVLAALNRTSDISLGVVVGSNIFTLLVVLGLAAIIRPFHVKMVIEERDSVWLLLSSAVILIFVPDGISRWEGVVLLVLYFPYMYSVYSRERREIKKVSARPGGTLKKGKEMFILFVAAFIMLASAEVVLRSGLKLATLLQIPELVVGLVLMGIGASIPEIAIGISSALKRKTDITLGDVYGTNIFTCLFILGVSAIIHPIPTSAQVQTFILPFLIFSTIILQLFFSTGHKVGRMAGILFIIIYMYFALATLNILPKP
ncbi:MAG: sodium:calcium antiporter [Candidatus Aminicenantes bacterium]|nr:sodium:calcium antiporter [Candidatus Aminicenantes bacterium]